MYVPLKVLEAFGGQEKEAQNAIFQQASIWRTGRDVTDKHKEMSFEDAVALPNASIVIPHVMTQFVKEGIEPMIIGSRLLTRVQYQPGLQIQFPAIGSLYAEDVAPGQSLPEFAPDMGGHVTNEIKVGKSGLALKIFDEIIRFSQYNLVAFWLSLAGQALARHKERKIFNFISAIGTTAFDNTDRTLSVTGRWTSGRNTDGGLNGSITMDDIFEMYTLGLQQGFIMDTILVHPLTWLMWLRDPVLRSFQLQYGGGAWWNMWQGDPRNRNDLAAFPPLGEGTGQLVNPPGGGAGAPTATAIEDWDQRLTSKPTPPSYLGLSFNIIPSPFVSFNVTNNTADIIMFNSQNLGALIVDEEPRVLEWTQPDLGLRKMQIAERYGLAILNEGQGIVVARDVKCTRNYVADESVTPTLSISGALVNPATSGVASPL
jgi:hypothetical protein